jgi:hypothetical protein
MAATCRSATVGEQMVSPAASRKDSQPLAVFNEDVDMSEFTGELGEGWSRIECVSKKAYGCGDLGNTLVESLRLYARFGDYPLLNSSLAIRMNDEAVRRIEAELGAPNNAKHHPGDWMRSVACFEIADGRLISIMLVFHNRHSDRICYHLVYDAIDSSLSLINYLPDANASAQRPVLNRIGNRGGDYELVLLAAEDPLCITEGLLCMCIPESRANENPSADGSGPWRVMRRRFPKQVPESFLADLAFAFQGKAFWADFMQG